MIFLLCHSLPSPLLFNSLVPMVAARSLNFTRTIFHFSRFHSRRKSQRRRVAIHIKCEENKTEIITNHNEVYSTPQTVVILCKNVCHSKGKLLSILFIFFIWLLFICPLAGWCVLVPKKLLWSTQYKTKMNSFGFIAR